MRFRTLVIALAAILLAIVLANLPPAGDEPPPTPAPRGEPAGSPGPPDAPGPGEPTSPPDEEPSLPPAAWEGRAVSEEGEPFGDYRVGGVVVTPQDEPVAGAGVVLDLPFDPDLAVRTAPDGRFRFSGLDGEDELHQLVVRARGRPEVRVGAAPGRTDLRIVVGARTDVEGVVVFPDGSPASGAEVDFAGRKATTNHAGRFRFPDVPARAGTLVATLGRHPAFGTEEDGPPRFRGGAVFHPESGELPRIELRETDRSWLRARVVDGSGAPRAGIALVYPGRSAAEGPTGDDGRATLAVGMPAGSRVRVRAVDATGEPPRPGVIFEAATAPAPDRAREVTVVLPPWRRVTLVAVAGDGRPLPPDETAEFEISSGTFREDPDRPRGHDRQSFLVHPEPAFRPFVRARAPGRVEYLGRLEPGSGDAEIRLPLPRAATVAGRLVAASGRPLTHGLVQLSAEGRHLGSAAPEGADGSFRVTGLPPGRAVLTAGPEDGMRGAKREVVLVAGEVTEVGEVRLVGPVRIRGRVTDRAGRPLGGAKVRVARERPGYWPDPTHSHADGRFDLPVPADLEAHLLVSRSGFGTVAVPFDARDAEREIPVTLPREARLRVNVLRPEPVSGAWSLRFRLPGRDFSWQEPEIAGSTDDSRLFGGLAPGRVIVFIETVRGRSEAEVSLRAGETAEVSLAIR